MIARPMTIIGGRLALPHGEPLPGGIRCENGLIAALGDIAPQDGDEVIDAHGALVAPGLVDFGVFAIDKPAFHFGGITRAALMPDQAPPLDHPARVRFAALSGKPDKPENYHTVTIKLSGSGKKTEVSLAQDNNTNEEARKESQKNWGGMLEGLKKYVEKA